MTHSLEWTVPTASSSGRFLRLPTTLPTLDSLYLQGNFRSRHRSQPLPDLLPSHLTLAAKHWLQALLNFIGFKLVVEAAASRTVEAAAYSLFPC